MNTTSKYLAIKVQGLNHWLWFERAKTIEELGVFTGTGGWGERGAHTEIRVATDLIEGEIASENLHYT